ncbi:hypothetical protein GCM10010295_56280 [Streptomyces intermedius]
MAVEVGAGAAVAAVAVPMTPNPAPATRARALSAERIFMEVLLAGRVRSTRRWGVRGGGAEAVRGGADA